MDSFLTSTLVFPFKVLDQSGVWNHLMLWTMTLSPVMAISEDYVTVKTLIRYTDSRSHLHQWTELKLSGLKTGNGYKHLYLKHDREQIRRKWTLNRDKKLMLRPS